MPRNRMTAAQYRGFLEARAKPIRKAQPRERDVQAAILRYLALHGVFVWRNQSTGIFDPTRQRFRTLTGLKGTSDILGCTRNGRLLAIEVKRKGGKPSPDQERFLERARSFGAVAFVAKSIDDVQARMTEIMAA